MKKRLKKILISIVMFIIIVVTYMLTDGFGEAWFNNTDASREFEETTLVRVVDGDTIVVNLDDENVRVRFIGIDAPESVHSDESKNTEEGELSAAYLKSILEEGEPLYLQYDVELQDTYGRTLAYVWTSNEVDINSKDDVVKYMLNAILLKEGYAKVAEYPPNTKYQHIFKGLEQ